MNQKINKTCTCKFDSIMNNDKCRCECKNPKEHHVCKKNYSWNLGHVFVRIAEF